MLRNPHMKNFLRKMVISPRPFYYPIYAFSENNNNNKKSDNKNEPNSRMKSFKEQIIKLNSYLENRETALINYLSNLRKERARYQTKQNILLLLMVIWILGYNFKNIFQQIDSISHSELIYKYVPNHLISKICIKKVVDSVGYYYKADVFLTSGEKKVLEIGNLDNFLESLEKVQLENSMSSSKALIPIEYAHSRTWVELYEHYYNFIYGGVSLIVLLGFIKRLTRESKMNNSRGGIFGIGKRIFFK